MRDERRNVKKLCPSALSENCMSDNLPKFFFFSISPVNVYCGAALSSTWSGRCWLWVVLGGMTMGNAIR